MRRFLEWMRARWPVVAQSAPLVIGADKTIIPIAMEAGFTRRVIKLAIGRHVWRSAYLKNLQRSDAYRHDLDGKPIAPVAPEHQKRASEQLAARDAKKG